MRVSENPSRRAFLKAAALATATGAVVAPAVAHASSLSDTLGSIFGNTDITAEPEPEPDATLPAGAVNYRDLLMATLDAKGLKYRVIDNFTIGISYAGDNVDSIDILAIFDDDGDPYVDLESWSIGNFGGELWNAGLEACNEANASYRWARFCLDSDSDVEIAIDAILDEQTGGEEVYELISRMVMIIDDVYPSFASAMASGTGRTV